VRGEYESSRAPAVTWMASSRPTPSDTRHVIAVLEIHVELCAARGWGLGFEDQGFGFWVMGFRVQGSGLRGLRQPPDPLGHSARHRRVGDPCGALLSGSRISVLDFGLWGLVFRVQAWG